MKRLNRGQSILAFLRSWSISTRNPRAKSVNLMSLTNKFRTVQVFEWAKVVFKGMSSLGTKPWIQKKILKVITIKIAKCCQRFRFLHASDIRYTGQLVYCWNHLHCDPANEIFGMCLKRGKQRNARNACNAKATQGFTQWTGRTQPTQEVANNVTGICHVI